MESPTLLVVECYPAMLLPSSHPSRREYLMWWESEDDVLGMIPQLRMVTKSTGRFSSQFEWRTEGCRQKQRSSRRCDATT